MDPQSSSLHFFEELSTWREESHREFSNIITTHSSSINKGINALVEEVSELKIKLSVVTKERNDLLETVHNLSNDIRQRNAELPCADPLLEAEEERSPRPEVIYDKEKNVEVSSINSENDDPDEITLNKFADVDNVDHVQDNVNQENQSDKETIGQIERGEVSMDSKPSKSLQYESEYSKDTIYDDTNHVCPECIFPFSTSENLEIHTKNVHPNVEVISHRQSIKPRADKKFKCEKCPYRSSRPDYIKNHTKAVHEKIRNHVCGECGYAASQKGHLNKHIKSVHENIRNHFCGECGYAASQNWVLKRHIEVVHKSL